MGLGFVGLGFGHPHAASRLTLPFLPLSSASLPLLSLLHLPASLPDQEESIIRVLRDFVDYGGLGGLLSQSGSPHSTAPTDYAIGTGTRTVVVTGLSEEAARKHGAR